MPQVDYLMDHNNVNIMFETTLKAILSIVKTPTSIRVDGAYYESHTIKENAPNDVVTIYLSDEGFINTPDQKIIFNKQRKAEFLDIRNLAHQIEFSSTM